MRALPVAAIAAIAGIAGAARAEPSADTRIVAKLDARGRALSGHAQIGFQNTTGAPLATAVVWLGANRFRVRPGALDDINGRWVYPAGFDAGFVVVGDTVVDGAAAAHRVVDHPLAGPRTLL